ncbi:NAD(P)-dependent oxidoreductase [Saccharopolyspora sp. NPDC050642]|uniref:NAD(P)-dependent oxidoreductase n=1 Tax=Saccharopolyspora sp. NPDC050642 TaxID=3157099 RepID=UPI0033E58CAF
MTDTAMAVHPDWRIEQMPALRELLAQWGGVPMHDRKALVLVDPGGADLVLARALGELGCEVHLAHRSTAAGDDENLLGQAEAEALLREFAPDLLFDHDGFLTRIAHRAAPDVTGALLGVVNRTDSAPLDIRLEVPVLEAHPPRMFALLHLAEARQRALWQVMACADLQPAGRRVAVVGFGAVGGMVAGYCTAMGMRVVVVEPDPVEALGAHFQGHEVRSRDAAVTESSVVIFTGRPSLVDITSLPDGSLAAVVDPRLAEQIVHGLDGVCATRTHVRPGLTEYELGRGTRIYFAGDGTGPPGVGEQTTEVTELQVALALLGADHLLAEGHDPGQHELPRALGDRVAAMKLMRLAETRRL